MKKYLSIILLALGAGAFSSGMVQTIFSAFAVQNEIIPPTSGIYTGPQFSQLVGDGFRSVVSCNKGSSAPATVGGTAVDGLCWLDDTTSTWIKKRYVNGNWAIEGAYNATESTFAGVIGGGTNSLASASTTDLGSVPEANVSITGSVNIVSFGSSAPKGITKIIRFASTPTLTYSAALLLPGGYDLVAAANDRAVVTHLGGGSWEVTQYTRANGVPIDVSAVGDVKYTASVTIPAMYVPGYGQAISRSDYPAYVAKTSRAQNGTRVSGNATITSVADTSGFGAGMPVESTGVNAGCTIASLVDNVSITLNSSSCVTSSGTSTLTVFPYGYGTSGSSSTIGVPDCRGRSIAGRDRNDPGSFANRVTTAGAGVNSKIFGSAGGNEIKSILRTDLPNVQPTFAGTVNQAIHVTSDGLEIAGSGIIGGVGDVAGNAQASQNSNQGHQGSSGTFTATGTVQSLNGGVTQTPLTVLSPVLITECIVRVTP